MSPTRRRNIQFERDITHHCARGVVDPAELIEHAEARAGGHLSSEYVTDPMLVRTDVDEIHDASEELADARNRLVWWLEHNLNDPTVHFKQNALRHIILAYQQLGVEA